MPTHSKTLLSRYHYDALDRLVDCRLSGQESARSFYHKDRLATEINGAVKHSIMQHEDQLLAQQQRQNEFLETSLLATDQQRSVLTVLDESEPRPITHTPYGHRPLASGLLSLLGFNGERSDPVTGCYLLGNGYRAFNPVLMRFNSPDNASPFGSGGVNAYAYCMGDPVNRFDQTGHVSWLHLMAKHFPDAMNAAKKLRSITSPRPSPRMLDSLPNELIDKISDHLPGKDLVSFASTSKRMNAVVNSEVRHKKFINYLETASQPLERLLKLDAAGLGSVKGIPPKYAVDSGYTRTEVIKTIAELNRRPYLPEIERVQELRRAEDLERVSEEIRASFGDIW
jgi:RHS repeat-associated protein